MGNSNRVDVYPRQEPIVARDMFSSLGSSNSQVMKFILHLGVVLVQLISGIVTISSMRNLILCMEEAALRGIGFSW